MVKHRHTLIHNKKLTAQLTTTASIILALISVALFFQGDWASSWGPFLTLSGVAIAVASLAFANIKNHIVSLSTKYTTNTQNKQAKLTN
jgi:CHASE2 domain-containing sensor protein